jgi:hypothetical protein
VEPYRPLGGPATPVHPRRLTPLALVAKYRFLDAPEGSWLPSLGLLPFVKLPVSEEMLFTDLFYATRDERQGRDGLLLDAGVIWRPTPDVALDASVVTSLAGRGPDWALRGGVSVRFGR